MGERERGREGDGKSGRKKAFVTKHRKICVKWRQAEKATTQAIVDTVECVRVCVYVFNTDSSVDMCLHIRVSLEHNKVFKLNRRSNYCRLVLIARKER